MPIIVSPSKRSARGRGALVFVAAMVATAIGCGVSSTPTAHVAGRVTLGGKPIPSDAEAAIRFVSETTKGEKVSVAVPINVGDGQYDSPKTPQGTVRAYFSINRKGPTKMSQRTGEEYQDIINLVPAKYATGVSLEVTGDNTSQDFDL